jgi:hypothetical protein
MPNAPKARPRPNLLIATLFGRARDPGKAQ